MVLEVGVQEVGIDGVDDVGRQEEAVGVRARLEVRPVVRAVELRQRFGRALEHVRQEVAACALSQERSNLFVVEHRRHLDDAALVLARLGTRREKGLESGERAQLVVDSAGEDEIPVDPAELSRLGVEQFELPADHVF